MIVSNMCKKDVNEKITKDASLCATILDNWKITGPQI